MKKLGLVVALSSVLYSGSSFAECEGNVDKLQLFYINGMFTSYEGASDNLEFLERT